MGKKAEDTAGEGDNLNMESEKGLGKKEAQEQQINEVSKYTINEFCTSSQKIFGIHQDAVRAALMKSGKPVYTISEARELVKRYIERQVK